MSVRRLAQPGRLGDATELRPAISARRERADGVRTPRVPCAEGVGVGVDCAEACAAVAALAVDGGGEGAAASLGSMRLVDGGD